jgi:hypothetical protein
LSHDINAALEIAKMLDTDGLKAIFDWLLDKASYGNAYTGTCEQLILSLPNQWLKDNIEKSAEPLLAQDDPYEESAQLLHLYHQIDPNLEIQLAKRLLENEDEEIRELGQDALDNLQDK